MKIFLVFSPKFLEWPLAIARELQRRKPEVRVSGLAAGPQAIFNKISAEKDPAISPLVWLDDLEREWISTPCDYVRLEKYETMLGPGTIKRIITADRQIGTGLVSGGIIPKTRLMEIVEDTEMIRRYVFGLLNYLFDTFEQNRPDLVFLRGSAGAFSVALSKVCSKMRIPFARLTSARIGMRYIIDDSPEGLMSPVDRIFKKALDNPSRLSHTLPAAHKYLEQFREKPEKPEYASSVHAQHIRAWGLRAIGKQALANFRGVVSEVVRRPQRHLRGTTAWRLMSHRLSVGLRARRLAPKGPFCLSGKIPDRPFCYFPLHVDPEASTMVMAPMHTNQKAVIEALIKSLPVGMNLVVKEHIPMLGARPRGFYDKIRVMPGVVLASPFEDSISLIKRASLACVITGTAALEAILLKRPAIIIGVSPFLAIDEGLVHCPDLSSLPATVDTALRLAPADDDRLALYLAAVMDQSFDFPNELNWGKVTEEDVGRNPIILNSICDRILRVVGDSHRNLT